MKSPENTINTETETVAVESLEKKEGWAEIEKIEELSRLDLTLELLEEAPFDVEDRKFPEQRYRKTTIHEQRLRDFMEARKNRLAESDRRDRLCEAKSELPSTPELSLNIKEILQEVEVLANDLGFFSKRFLDRKNDFKLRLEIIDSDQEFMGWFLCEEWVKSSPDKEKANELRVGMKGIKRFASGLRLRASESGVTLTKDISIALALYGTVAHEYGHYIDHVISSEPNYGVNPALDESAEKVRPLDIKIDGHNNISSEKSAIRSERFAQSIASCVLEKKIESLGLPTEQRDIIRRLSLDTNPDKVDKYQQIFEWAKKRDLSMDGLENVMSALFLFCVDHKMDEAKDKILHTFRSLGYYLEPYTATELKSIIQAVE